jgi:hypothetical protein
VSAAIIAEALLDFGATTNPAYNVLAHIVWMLDDLAWCQVSVESVALSLDLSEAEVETSLGSLVDRGALHMRETSDDPLYRLNAAYPADRTSRVAARN